jgi:hypothetical protein
MSKRPPYLGEVVVVVVVQVDSQMGICIYLEYRRARGIPANGSTAPFLCNAGARQCLFMFARSESGSEVWK